MLSSCSFCGERPAPGSGVVTGPGVAICRSCAAIAVEVLAEPAAVDDAYVLSDCRVLAPHLKTPRIDSTPDASVVVKRGQVAWVGGTSDLPGRYRDLPVVDCEGRAVLPGLVDAGAWLLGSSHAARPDASALVGAARAAASNMLTSGVTTLDVRVGGSSDPVLDTLLLAAARTVGESALSQTVVTWVVSLELSIREIEEVLAPTACRLASLGLVVDDGAGDLEPRLSAIAPLAPRVLTVSKPEVKTDRVVSVEFVGRPVSVPGIPIVLRPDVFVAHGNVADIVSDGCLPALASGFDPHGVEAPGMGWAMLLAVEAGGLEPAESVWAATRGAALALGDRERGVVRAGAVADLLVVDADGPEDLVRRPSARPWMVLVSGVPIRE